MIVCILLTTIGQKTMTLIRIAEALEVSPRDFFPANDTSSDKNIRNEIKNEIIELLSKL